MASFARMFRRLALMVAVAGLGNCNNDPAGEEPGSLDQSLSLYTLVVSAPAEGATVGGDVVVTGMAPGFVNVEVWDAAHHSPPLAQVKPAADGTFSATVHTSALANGATTWTIWAWDVPPGGVAQHSTSTPLHVTIQNQPQYTVAVTSPAEGATVGGDVVVTGKAPGFVNVEVWDAAHHSPPLAQVKPAADGTFSATVHTAALPNGADTWTIWGWDVPPGGTAQHSASTPLHVTIANGGTTMTGCSVDATGAIDITAYGASTQAGFDNAAAIKAALAAGKAAGKPVHVPAGTFGYKGILVVDGVTFFGEGDASVLVAQDVTNEAITLRHDGAKAISLALHSGGQTRLNTPASAEVWVDGATNFEVGCVHVQGSSSAGIFVYGASYGVIHDNRVASTLADAIHMTNASHDLEVHHRSVSR